VVEHFLGKEEVTGSSPVVGSSIVRSPEGNQAQYEFEGKHADRGPKVDIGRMLVMAW
jgi:hypothetical protein